MSEQTATVVELYISPVAGDPISMEKLELHVGMGAVGDKHYGTRLSDVREKQVFGLAKGLPVLNWRQLAITSQAEQQAIAETMQVDATYVTGKQLFSNIVLAGIPEVSALPPFTRLEFGGEGRPIVLVTLQNQPCIIPGQAIAKASGGDNRIAGKFAKAAMHKRGVMGMVFLSGRIKIGDTVKTILP